LGIGDWGLGIGDWAIPNPQSPIPKLIKITIKTNNINYNKYFINLKIFIN